MPGPAPKPSALKKLAGNPGKRKLNNNEPQPERVAPAIPRGLMALARKYWKAHGPKLEDLGLLTEVDGAAFTMLTMHYAIAWEAGQILKDKGLSAVDENGAERKHPLLQVFRENSSMFLRYAKEFGLTPSARVKLAMPSPEEEEDLRDILMRFVND